MEKIELTPERERIIKDTCDEFLSYGYSTDVADYARAEKAISALYKSRDLPPPKYYYRAVSPLEAEVAIHFLKNSININLDDNLWDNLWVNLWVNLRVNLRDNLWDNLRDNLRDNLWDNLRDNLRVNLRDNLRDNLWDNLRVNLRDNLRVNLRDNLWDNLRVNLRDNLRVNLRDNLWDNLWDNLRDNLRDNLWDNLRDNLRDNLWVKKIEFTGTWFSGSWDFAWGWLEGGRRIGAPYSEKDCKSLDAHIEIVKSCGWVYLYPEIAIICDRPNEICLNNNRLHNSSDAALTYRDGYKLYALNGIIVPEYVVMRPDEITGEKILAEKNTEVRRLMIERIGSQEFVRRAKAEVLGAAVDDLGFPMRCLSVKFSDGGEWTGVELTDSSPTYDNVNNQWRHKIYIIGTDGECYNGRARTDPHVAKASTYRYQDGSLVYKKPEDMVFEKET